MYDTAPFLQLDSSCIQVERLILSDAFHKIYIVACLPASTRIHPDEWEIGFIAQARSSGVGATKNLQILAMETK